MGFNARGLPELNTRIRDIGDMLKLKCDNVFLPD